MPLMLWWMLGMRHCDEKSLLSSKNIKAVPLIDGKQPGVNSELACQNKVDKNEKENFGVSCRMGALAVKWKGQEQFWRHCELILKKKDSKVFTNILLSIGNLPTTTCMDHQAGRAGFSWLSLSLRSETGNAVMISIDHLQYLTGINSCAHTSLKGATPIHVFRCIPRLVPQWAPVAGV